MMLAADIVQNETKAPHNRVCRSGHVVPVEALYLKRMVRFFSVTSIKQPSLNGVYCEICLVLAHAKANQNKRGY